jgi:hypothetical protein
MEQTTDQKHLELQEILVRNVYGRSGGADGIWGVGLEKERDLNLYMRTLAKTQP